VRSGAAVHRNCHCRDCQKSTGSAYVPALAGRRRALKITGDAKYYEIAPIAAIRLVAASDPIAARACSAVLGNAGDHRVTAAVLDDPSRFKPQRSIFTRQSAQPWDHMNPELPKFPKQPKT